MNDRSRSTRARTGRNAAAALVVIVVVLLQAVATTRATALPVAAAGSFDPAVLGRLGALADKLRADVQARPADGGAATTVRAWVRTAAAVGPATAECGFAFLVNDDAGRSSHVPPFERASCAGGVVHRVQFARPDATYEAAVAVPAAVDNVTFTSNGGDGLEIDSLCLGFGGAGGARAFCVDRPLLDACAAHGSSRPGNVFPGPTGIRLSRAFAGRVAPSCKEIVFHDVGGLARGFESLARSAGADGGARTDVCSRIGLLPETSAWAYDAAKCYAQRKDATADGDFYYVKMDANRLRDDCTPAAER